MTRTSSNIKAGASIMNTPTQTTKFSRAAFARCFGLALMVAALLTSVAFGQSPDPAARPDKGTKPVGSYSVSDIENISLVNGNVGLSIPLASLPPMPGGRLSLTVGAHYNSKFWETHSYENPADVFHNTNWTAQTLDVGNISGPGPWQVGGQYAIFQTVAEQDFVPLNPGCTGDADCLEKSYRFKITLVAPDGSKHELRPLGSSSQPTENFRMGFYNITPATSNNTMRYYSFDGSYLWASIAPYSGNPTTWSVYFPDGSVCTQAANGIQRITDTDGNSIKIFSETDSSGITTTHYQDEHTVGSAAGVREIKVVYDPNTNTGKVIYQATDGATETIGITYGTTHIDQLYNIGDKACGTSIMFHLIDDVPIIRSIQLPQSEPNQTRQFSFSYNTDQAEDAVSVSYHTDCSAPQQTQTSVSHGWAELSEMDLPSGASVKYEYTLDGDSSPARFYKGAKQVSKERITKKRLLHDGTEDDWIYTIGDSSGTVVGPDGSSTVETFYTTDAALSTDIAGALGKGGLVYSTVRSGIVKTERHWTLPVFTGGDASNPNGGAVFNPVVDAEYTTMLDQVNQQGNPTKMSAKTYTIDYNGNRLHETDYDWFDPSLVTRDSFGVPNGVPSSATVLRDISTSYYNSPGSNPGSAMIYANRDLATVSPRILNALQESTIGSSDAQLSYDGQVYGTAPTLGHLTQESRKKSGSGSSAVFVNTKHTYDTFGNLLTTTDPLANVTTYVYGDSTAALPTSVTVDPLNGSGKQTTTMVHDYQTGLIKSKTDPNGGRVSTDYTNILLAAADPFGRPATVTDPLGRTVVTRYHDTARQIEIWSDLIAAGDALLRTRTSSDKIGRAVLAETSEDGSTYGISSQTSYAQFGQIVKTSNPTRGTGEATDGWTRTTNDNLGRVIEVASFAGAFGDATTSTGSVTTSYSANQTTVTDQAAKTRSSLLDGLGRLAKVIEDPNGLNYSTTYGYDPLGNLTSVSQGAQSRSFVYDLLSRLTSAQNPEQQAAIAYGYDDDGNLLTKTNPNTTSVNFTYDGLNRVASKTLSTGGAWTYTYDARIDGTALPNGKGRLAAVTKGTEGYFYDSYDAAGRVLTSHQVTNAGGADQSYSMSYGYNLAGAMTSESYPSGRMLQMEYDNAGRLAGVKNQGSTSYYAGAMATDATNRIQYAAHGAISLMKLGNLNWEHTNYNSRLQPVVIGLGSSSTDASILRLDYTYNTATGSGTANADNNGNILTQKITIGSTAMSQGYGYDSLNRLSSATETGAWTQTYDCDRYGNRAVRNTSYIPSPSLTPQSANSTDFSAFNQTTNRIALTGFGYDSSGNLTGDPTTAANAIVYDSENHQTSYTKAGATTSYSYDAEGRRAKKTDSTGTTVFVYNVQGQLIAEYGGQATNGGTSYLTADHLASIRVLTNSSGVVISRHDYLPYGEEIASTIGARGLVGGYGAPDDTKQRFTSKERDNESNLDYFEARYFSSSQGRFTGCDPIYIEMGRLGDPQQLNLYPYTRNNPLKFLDPSGLDIEVTGTEQEAYRGRLQQDVSFNIQLNAKTNKVEIVDADGNVLDKNQLKALGKTLKGGEKELFNAITDTKHHVTIDTVRNSPEVDFGRFVGGGTNRVDAADLDLLDDPKNSGGLTSAQVVGHETLEAYAASKGDAFAGAHDYANKYFGGLELPDLSTVHVQGDTQRKLAIQFVVDVPLHTGKGSERITKVFATPIPYVDTRRGIKLVNPPKVVTGNISKVEYVP
jgi:RHS repeat-associated protein